LNEQVDTYITITAVGCTLTNWKHNEKEQYQLNLNIDDVLADCPHVPTVKFKVDIMRQREVTLDTNFTR
jgi:hypothetical protein